MEQQHQQKPVNKKACAAAGDAIKRAMELVESLPNEVQIGWGTLEKVEKDARAPQPMDMGQFKSRAIDILSSAESNVRDGKIAQAKCNLEDARIIVSAKATEIEIANCTLVELYAAAGASPVGAPPPPPVSNLIVKILGRLAGCLWQIIQTLLTPQGWSIEGGITVLGLTHAKLKIDFV